MEAAEKPRKLTRTERRSQETRARIISATEALIRTRPLDDLTIAEITDAADVGHGTFYVHFNSKYEVVVPIIHHYSAHWDAAAQAAAAHLEDPAEVVAHAARQIGRIIVSDALYRWFLQHSGVPVEDLRAALGVFVSRDIQRGMSSGRFELPESDAALDFLFGGIVTGLMSCFGTENPDSAVDDLAEMLLRGLGLSSDEAREIAHTSLEKIEVPETPVYSSEARS